MHRMYLAALLTAVLSLLLVPLGSAGGTRSPGVDPVISAPGSAKAGATVKYAYGVSGYKVTLFQATLALPKQMKLVRSTMPYKLVKGKPTWTFKNLLALTDNRGFFFYVKISKKARRGKLYFTMREHASNPELGYDKLYLDRFPTRITPSK